MRALLAFIFGALSAGIIGAHADELDGWCAQAKKAPSIVICSDAELRQQAIARNKLFETARAKLSPQAYKALTDEQSRWIKAYTARCGISIDDPPPPSPIPQTVIDCYRRESRARTAYLAASLSEPNPAASPRSANPFDAFDDNGNLRGGSPPPAAPAGHTSPAGDKALDAWTKCLDDAADSLIKQSETAPTVADAALYNCLNSEIAFSEATVKTGELSRDGFDRIKQIAKQRVIARVMAIRKTAKEVPSTRGFPANEAAAQNFDKWLDCTRTAIDALADQPEPAQTVAKAVVASCMIEQLAYQNSAGLSDRQMEADEAAIVASGVLARVMAVRAARAKLRQQSPGISPAIDYNRM